MRRFLLKISIASILLACACVSSANQKEDPLKFSILKPSGSFSTGIVNIEINRNANSISRKIPIQVWYPAEPKGVEKLAPYNTPEALAYMKQVTIDHHKIPEARLLNMMSASNNSYLNAPLSKKLNKYPVIIFSPGGGTPPQSYTALLEDLASHGFVVLSISHMKFPLVEEEMKMEFSEQHQIREDDEKALIKQLAQLKKSVSALERIDLYNIGLAGHSIGGSTSLQVCEEEKQCKCAVDIDGFLHAKNRPKQLHKPSLALMAKETNKESAELIELFAKSKNSGPSEYREIERMNHFSFTDSWLLLPLLAEKEKTISGEEGITATRKILLWFFEKHLNGKRRNFPVFSSVVVTKK